MAIRINLTVDDDVPGMLSELGVSERKRGEYISGLIRSAYAKDLNIKEKEDSIMREVQAANTRVKNVEEKIEALESRIALLERRAR